MSGEASASWYRGPMAPHVGIVTTATQRRASVSSACFVRLLAILEEDLHVEEGGIVDKEGIDYLLEMASLIAQMVIYAREHQREKKP